MNKKIIIISGILGIVGIIAWAFFESSKPLPGTQYSDEGRDHVPISEKVEYKTNPPTSGKHNADWIKAGVYSHPEEDAYLIHSLEHGYIIMSYNCDYKTSLIPVAYAHLGEEEEAIGGEDATGSAKLPESFKSEDCQKLKDSLVAIYNKKGQKKLIVVPRPNLDAKIALTAWRRLDKFNPSTGSGLSDSEIQRIEKFIDAHRDKGPEKTME